MGGQILGYNTYISNLFRRLAVVSPEITVNKLGRPVGLCHNVLRKKSVIIITDGLKDYFLVKYAKALYEP